MNIYENVQGLVKLKRTPKRSEISGFPEISSQKMIKLSRIRGIYFGVTVFIPMCKTKNPDKAGIGRITKEDYYSPTTSNSTSVALPFPNSMWAL